MSAISNKVKTTASATRNQAFRTPKGRAAYPKRKTVDFSVEQAQWLEQQAYDQRVSAVAIIRAALDHLANHDDARNAVMTAAHEAEHGQ